MGRRDDHHYKRVMRGSFTMDMDDAKLALQTVLHVEITDVHDVTISRRALELTADLGLPATYDAGYLTLAEREGCECWTADERLWHAAAKRLPWVHWIGNVTVATE